MITLEKSLPGSGKNLKWLPEMAFQVFQTSLVTGASGARLACLPTHKFLATAMTGLGRVFQSMIRLILE